MKQNVLLSKSRGQLTARKSIQAIINYAFEQDKKFIARKYVSKFNTGIYGALLGTPLIFGLIYYFTDNWQRIHPVGLFNVFLFSGKKPLSTLYAPEIYVKETAELRLRVLNKLEKEVPHLWT